MPFELSSEYLDQLRQAIRKDDEKFVLEQIKDLYPADIAEIFDELNLEEAKYVYSKVDPGLASDIMVELEDDVREKFLASLTSKEIAEQFIDNMESDDAADVLSELSDEVQDEVLSHIEDEEQASDIIDLLHYDEHTAGGLMDKEFVKVKVNDNLVECVREIRKQAEGVEILYAVYVVDDGEKLLGFLPLQELIISPVRSKVAEIYNSKVISVKAHTPAEEVANVMDKYSLVVLPVVDALDRLVGRITIDDVIDFRREEETEDVQKMGGMEALEEPYISVPFFEMIKKRAGWLILLFLGETLTATAMSFYEDEIGKAVVLALFVPLIISSGGNSGSQASTLVIRALALGEITVRDWWRIIKKEVSTGLVLGSLLGIIGFIRVVAWSQIFPNIYGPYYTLIGFTVGLSLVGVVMWGTITGSVLPLFLKRLGLDPAVSSAPFVATLVDVTGLIIYFTFASILLGGLLL